MNVMWKKFKTVLGRPLFGTRVIPPGARVDPALFAEDEFPVHCPKCDYLLRGLPDGRCPECGTEFERGRLLVEQYVTRPLEWHRRTSRSRRVLVLGVVAGFTLMGVSAYVAPLVMPFLVREASASGPRAISASLEGMAMGMRAILRAAGPGAGRPARAGGGECPGLLASPGPAAAGGRCDRDRYR